MRSRNREWHGPHLVIPRGFAVDPQPTPRACDQWERYSFSELILIWEIVEAINELNN